MPTDRCGKPADRNVMQKEAEKKFNARANV